MRQATGTGMRGRIGEIVRYGAVGATLVAIEYTLYLALLAIRPGAVLSAFVAARIVAGAVGYVGHARFTFAGVPMSVRGLLLYALSVAGNMALAALLLVATLPLLGPLLAKMAGDAAAIAAAYLLGRHLVFLSPRQEAVR